MVTFGIAVYNVELYLNGCIESVMAQKGDDIEILIVDDGSTDRSREIVDEYAAKDSRIRVFHKPNGGVSTARNMIINEAQGEWVLFIDGDDKLTGNTSEIIRQYMDGDYDVVYFDALFFRFDHSIPQYAIQAGDKVIAAKDEIKTLAFATLYPNRHTPNYINKTIVTVWGKMYRLDYLKENHILFDELLRKSQDVAFNLVCVRSMEKCILVRKATYMYRLNAQSIVHRFNPNIVEYNRRLASAFWDIVNAFSDDVRDEMIKRYHMFCMMLIYTTLQLYFCHRDNPRSFSQRRSEFEEFMKNQWCIEAIKLSPVEDMNKSDVLISEHIVQNDFKALNRYFRKKDMNEFIKLISHRLGLNKIRSKIRQKFHQKGGIV